MQSIHIHFFMKEDSAVLIRICKQFIQPMYQYGVLVYGAAKKKPL